MVTIIGTSSLMAFPRIRVASAMINVQSAQSALTASVARTRATAVQRGRPARLYFVGSRARTTVVNVDGTETTIGAPTQLDTLFGVKGKVTPGDSSYIQFDSRGVGQSGTGAAMVKVDLTWGTAHTGRFCVTRFGMIVRGAALKKGC